MFLIFMKDLEGDLLNWNVLQFFERAPKKGKSKFSSEKKREKSDFRVVASRERKCF